MGDSLKKVHRGEPMAIPAAAYNAFVDAAQDYRHRSVNQGPGGLLSDSRQPSTILVRNNSLADRQRFEILGIFDPVIKPTDNSDEFFNAPIITMKGVLPQTPPTGGISGSWGRFAVLLEPVKFGEIGRAVIDGICLVKVEMVYESHKYADVIAGSAAKLRSGYAGSAYLLWVQPSADRDPPGDPTAWCVARIGVTGPEYRYIARTFWAQLGTPVVESSNRWTYPFSELVKTDIGYGLGVWGAAPYPLSGTAYNFFELGNTANGMLGIGVTGAELSDVSCPMELRAVPEGSIVRMMQIVVHKATGSPVLEYWFERANGVWGAA